MHRIPPRRLGLAVLTLCTLASLAACRPASGGAPPGVDPAIVHAFETAWAGAPPGAIAYMEQTVIPRESGWDPCAINPGRRDCNAYAPATAAGLTQLLNHYDLILQACPNPYAPLWQDPYCNARAAFFLSGGGRNLSPWNGPNFTALHTGPTLSYQLVVLKMGSTDRYRYLGAHAMVEQEAIDRWTFVTAANFAESLVVGAENAKWAGLHQCEEGNNWYASGSTSVGYFEGGLGILASLYESIAGHSALLDTPYQQELVGDVVLARFGPGAWGCGSRL